MARIEMTQLEEAIRDTVVNIYLETGAELTCAEIAEKGLWPVGKVRAAMNRHHGCLPGLVANEEHRPSHSKNYPGMTTGSHKVWVYAPTREHLRQMIRTLRGAQSDHGGTPCVHHIDGAPLR
jgi:hypothetical protein